MTVRRDSKLKTVLADLGRAQECIDHEEYGDAKAILDRVRAWCEREQIRSGHVSWLLAIVSDYLDDLPLALRHVEEALECDPISPSFHRSFEIVTDRIRRTLADPGRPPDDPLTPRLYELLARLGEADVPSHLAMARFQAHRGEAEAALRLVEAVTVLFPGQREPWLLKAALARNLGREPQAREAEFEAAALAAPLPLGFPMPGPARG